MTRFPFPLFLILSMPFMITAYNYRYHHNPLLLPDSYGGDGMTGGGYRLRTHHINNQNQGHNHQQENEESEGSSIDCLEGDDRRAVYSQRRFVGLDVMSTRMYNPAITRLCRRRNSNNWRRRHRINSIAGINNLLNSDMGRRGYHHFSQRTFGGW